MGTVYYGDDLDLLRRYLKDESVDLVYLDPPFNSAQNYNALINQHKLNGRKYPRVQLRTVKELMEGKAIERPSSVAAVDETFKKAPKAKAKGEEQGGLSL